MSNENLNDSGYLQYFRKRVILQRYLLIIRLHKTTNQNVLLFDCDANVAVLLPWNIYNVLTCRNQHFSKCNALVLYLRIIPGPRSLLLGVASGFLLSGIYCSICDTVNMVPIVSIFCCHHQVFAYLVLPVIVMAGSVAMTGVALAVVMMDKTVVVMMFQQCNGFVKAMIKFCEFYFLASMLYLDESCLLSLPSSFTSGSCSLILGVMARKNHTDIEGRVRLLMVLISVDVISKESIMIKG
ncbi:hypothetical protein BD770DRAFT_405959 [Pilaira anomala]|nr:hypothetical protein BD770DRAFT_405959 [Pilaira anomala]